MTTVERWTGREAKALRTAKRMSLEAFAAHLGVSERTLSTWESRGEHITIRAVNQAALDTSLRVSSPDVHERFIRLTEAFTTVLPDHSDTAAAVQEMPVERHERHPHDGKQMALGDAGVYLAGPDNKPTWVPAFYIDIFPVTNTDYARFVAATGHQPPQHWPKGKCPDTLFDHPVTYVTWHDATAYASWTGKQLPIAQQWEKAARGVRGDTYPWGDQPTPAKCNTRESGIGTTTPVNRYHSGVSPYGVYDLCGNTWEWTGTRTTQGRYELKAGAFTSPFARATPSSFNDAASTMLDDHRLPLLRTRVRSARLVVHRNGVGDHLLRTTGRPVPGHLTQSCRVDCSWGAAPSRHPEHHGARPVILPRRTGRPLA